MSQPETAAPAPELTPRQKEISALLESGRLEEGRDALVAMIEDEAANPHQPNVVGARILLSKVHALLGEPKKAEAALVPLQAIPEEDPQRTMVLINAQGLVSLLCRNQGRMEEAFGLVSGMLQFFDQAVGDPVNPDSFRAILQMVQIAREGQQFQTALDLCAKGIERFQGKVGEAHAHLVLQAGAVFMAAEQYDSAREHFEAILNQVMEQGGEKHELAARAHHFLAQLEQEMDNPAKAVDHMEKCLQILSEGGDPEFVVEVQHQLIQWQQDEMDAQVALDALNALKVLATRVHGPRAPRTAEVVSSLGYHHRKQGEGIKARECYQEALSIWQSWRAPEDPKVTVLQSILSDLSA
jgi:tetratricopeptide (TPR) repeat protein